LHGPRFSVLDRTQTGYGRGEGPCPYQKIKKVPTT